jgi:hypothetical protein
VREEFRKGDATSLNPRRAENVPQSASVILESGSRPPRRQIRHRALEPEQRLAFDRLLLSGEPVERLARKFRIELWYARQRASSVLARQQRGDILRLPIPDNDPAEALPDGLTPTEYARQILGGRVVVLPGGHFRLGDVPAGPREIVRAANAVLRERGRPEIRYPGLQPLQG